MFSFYLTGLKKLVEVGKKILLVVIVFTSVIAIFINFIDKDKPQSQVDLIKKNREEIYKVINDPKLNSTKEGKLTIITYRMMLCGMIGEACTDNPTDGDKNFQKSVFGFISNLIVLPYAHPPASGIYWTYNSLQNAGFIPKTYAAEGLGFAALQPLLNVWKIFRDFAYMILVLVLIAIGFMIMFRMKLNPQTVISVENALPKIIISLLLITFSFPIAGFLVDLMYFLIILTISLLSQRTNLLNATELIDRYTNASFATLFSLPFAGPFWPGGRLDSLSVLLNLGQAIVNILPMWINQILRFLTGALITFLITPWGPLHTLYTHLSYFIGKIFEAIPVIGGGVAGLASFILSPLFMFVIGVFLFIVGYSVLPLIIAILVLFTLIFLLFRIFFLLFATYIRILIMIIFSPIILLFEAIPGKSTFSWWFKNLLAEFLTFPLIIGILIVGYLIVNTPATRSVNLWQPPFLSDLQPDAFLMILGMALILIIPDFVKMVKELLGTKGMPIGIGLGTFFGGVAAGFGAGMGIMSQYTSLAQIPVLRDLISSTGVGQRLNKALIPPSPQQIANQQLVGILKGLQALATKDAQKQEIDQLIRNVEESVRGRHF